MIEVKDLVKRYGPIAAIDGVSFRVESGEILGFLGPNAAGKTTTMRILTGFSPPTSGTALVEGFDITRNPIEVKRRVGYLPENVPLYGEMLVSSFLRYVAEIKGIPRQARTREVNLAMERCGVAHMAKRIIANLSKGYRQRVGLAQALIGNPPVLILDEPTVGLDPQQIVEIRRMIKDLAREHTVLLSTHILPEVTMICQRVLIIHRGRIVAQDSMENLVGGPKTTCEIQIGVPEAGFNGNDDEGADRIRRILMGLGGVENVVYEGEGRFSVQGASGGFWRDRIAGAIVESGYTLRTLRERGRTLEDIFVSAVTSDAGDPS